MQIMAGRALNRPVTSDPDVQADSSDTLQQTAISTRAYELWRERGCPNGSDQDDWFRAEQELKAHGAPPPKAS
jgi:hypothetical protein